MVLRIWSDIHSIILNGLGEVKIQARITLLASLVNIPLTICLLRIYGIKGAIYSTVIAFLPFALYGRIRLKNILYDSLSK